MTDLQVIFNTMAQITNNLIMKGWTAADAQAAAKTTVETMLKDSVSLLKLIPADA